MEFSGWLGFLSASIFLAFVPGPDNIFVLLQSATNGFRSGIIVILGLWSLYLLYLACGAWHAPIVA